MKYNFFFFFLAKEKHIPGSVEWRKYPKDKQVQMVLLCTHRETHSQQASSGLEPDGV